MGSPLPPDPYIALGLPKDATQAQIKTAHRKLVLKCHPDKVSDPDAKQAASDQFHKIQTAYEILVDEDRRARYDAQVRLAGLRKEAMERQASGDSRRDVPRSAPPYRYSDEPLPRPPFASRDSERVTPQYEERRPSFAKEYFDNPPRASGRKDADYERTSRRSTHDTKEKPRVSVREKESKESERERRKEKTRKAERDTRRDRDRKYSTYVEEESESNSDEYAQRSRRMREEDDAAAARKARDAYYAQAYRQSQEAKDGYFDDRARKMFSATADAWDHIRSSRTRPRPDSEPRRPSPVRQGSSKEYIKRKDGRPSVMVRKASERPKTTGRDMEPSKKTSSRTPERRSSEEIVEQETKRPPTLNQTRSSPADIRIPTDKPRAQSVQVESDNMPEIPRVRRSETMPYDSQPRRSENTAPTKSSNLRPTESTENIPTPGATPEYNGPSAAGSTKYRYGRQYADDAEYPTPDGYRTEERQPASSARPAYTRRMTRSPSPVKDSREPRETPREGRERDMRESRELPRDVPRTSRTASARYPSSPQPPPLNTRTTSTSYVYTPGQGVEARGASGRGSSPRDAQYGGLYGEIPSSRTPQESPRSKYPAPEESVRYQRPIRPEELKVQSGYSYSKRPTERPSVSRSGSGNPVYTSVRG